MSSLCLTPMQGESWAISYMVCSCTLMYVYMHGLEARASVLCTR